MTKLYFAFFAVILIFNLSGCQGEQNVNFTKEDGDKSDISDLDLDIKQEQEEENPYSRWLTTAPPANEDKYSKMEFEAKSFDMFAIIKNIKVLDSNNTSLHEANGAVTIDTGNNMSDLLVPELPYEFSHMDLLLDRFQMSVKGGGDGRGIVVNGEDWQVKGGGDGRGIVLRHLILDRIEGNWQDVTIKMTLQTYTPPDTALERRNLVKELVESVEVWEDGKLVGRGNADKTLQLSSTLGLLSTGHTKCYSERGEVVTCEDSGQDAEWQYRSLSDFGTKEDNENIFVDYKRGFEWLKNQYIYDGGYLNQVYDGAIQFCNSHSARIPTIYEILTLSDFGVGGNGFPDAISSTDNIWTSTPAYKDNSDILIGVKSSHVEGLLLQKETKNNAQCILSEKPLAPHEEILDGYIDTFAGLMFGPIIKKQKWQNIIDTCKDSEEYGFTDWRAPNISELVILSRRLNLLKDKTIWSSSSPVDNPEMNWVLKNDGLW